MKKIVRSIAALAFLFTTNMSMANEPTLSTVTTSKSVVFKWEEDVINANLSFIDSDGNVIYNDKVAGVKDYIKKFNLNTLAAGNYYLIVEDGSKEITYSIKINENDVLIAAKDEIIKPVFKEEKGRLFFNYLNLDGEEVKVAIYDSFGRKLFKETFENEMYVSKVFNFSNAFDGDYTIVVKADSGTFYKYVSIK